MPATRRAFWKKKLEGNRERDKRNRRKLRNLGWRMLTVWECQIKRDPEKVKLRIQAFLEGDA